MEHPKVRNIVNDKGNGIAYHVMAYRNLTRDEMLHAVAGFLRQHKRPKRGNVIKIITIIGHDE